MTDTLTQTQVLLLSLQLGDSFFPSGASAFSFGLEGLQTLELVRTATQVEQLLVEQLTQRWVSSDRVALLHTHAAGDDLDAVAEIDRFVDCSSLVESWRLGGRRLGRVLLSAHHKLGTKLSTAYHARVEAGSAPGQVSVVQGLIGHALGLSAQATAALSAYGLAIGIVSPALRLGILGHIAAQQILLRQQGLFAELVERPLPPLDDSSSWLPATEVASMRQEARHGRLFAT